MSMSGMFSVREDAILDYLASAERAACDVVDISVALGWRMDLVLKSLKLMKENGLVDSTRLWFLSERRGEAIQ